MHRGVRGEKIKTVFFWGEVFLWEGLPASKLTGVESGTPSLKMSGGGEGSQVSGGTLGVEPLTGGQDPSLSLVWGGGVSFSTSTWESDGWAQPSFTLYCTRGCGAPTNSSGI